MDCTIPGLLPKTNHCRQRPFAVDEAALREKAAEKFKSEAWTTSWRREPGALEKVLRGPEIYSETEDGSPVDVYEVAATASQIADMLRRREISGVPWDYVTASFSEKELLANDAIKKAYDAWRS